MAYNGLTNAGAAYKAAREANNLPVEFLKAKVGNGIVPSGTDPAELTDIISGKMEVEITDIHQVERALKMTVQVSNESLTTGFYLTEIAIYVNDNGTPVLYWYIGKDNGTYVPDSTKPMKYKNILNIEVSSTPVTTVNYTGKDLWVDEEKLNIELDKKLDKGTYNGNAGTLKTAIDGKVSKAGDNVSGNFTMTGTAPIEIDVSSFTGTWGRGINYIKNENMIGSIGALGNDSGLVQLYISHGVGEPEIKILDGDVVVLSTRLNTNNKELVEAINELNARKMEGSMLATIFGTEYKGNIQTPGLKEKGKVYSSTTSNSFFMCIVDTNVVDVDYRYFTGASISDLVRKVFSSAKSILTPGQGYNVTYKQVNERLVWITYENLLTSNNSGVEYNLPFAVDSIAMARATSQSTNNYIKVLDGLSNSTFRLMSTAVLNDDVKVELLVYATNSLIDW